MATVLGTFWTDNYRVLLQSIHDKAAQKQGRDMGKSLRFGVQKEFPVVLWNRQVRVCQYCTAALTAYVDTGSHGCSPSHAAHLVMASLGLHVPWKV